MADPQTDLNEAALLNIPPPSALLHRTGSLDLEFPATTVHLAGLSPVATPAPSHGKPSARIYLERACAAPSNAHSVVNARAPTSAYSTNSAPHHGIPPFQRTSIGIRIDQHGNQFYQLGIGRFPGLKCPRSPLKSFHDDDMITKEDEIGALRSSYPMPKSVSPGWLDALRYGWFSTYRRLFALVLVANLTILLVGIARAGSGHESFTVNATATAAAVNLFALALVRHEHFINAIFRICSSLPHWTPLAVRRHAAKVYSYGGVHSGCGISALFWYIYFAVLLLTTYHSTRSRSVLALEILTALMIVLMLIIIGFAHPRIRRRFHNVWELSHRYGSWAAILNFWAQTIILTYVDVSSHRVGFGYALITTPSFWLLIATSILLLHPWLYLRRIPIQSDKLSDHAIQLNFKHKTLDLCMGTRLSECPFLDNHGFATIPNADATKGYSVIVSNAGDWTSKIIRNPPEHLWIRGAHTIGVMRVALLFNPVVIVATGSGIGPCLSLLQARPDWPCRIVWSARSPIQTFGAEIMRAVLRADPDAIIIDTKKTRMAPRKDECPEEGRSIFADVIYAAYRSIDAEAIIIISNPKVTNEIVYDFETLKIPAFGAIFDS